MQVEKKRDILMVEKEEFPSFFVIWLVFSLFFPGDTLPIPSGGNSKHANSEHTDTESSAEMDTVRQTERLKDRKHSQGLDIQLQEDKRSGCTDCGQCTLKRIRSELNFVSHQILLHLDICPSFLD